MSRIRQHDLTLLVLLIFAFVFLVTLPSNAATISRDFKWEVGISGQVITTTGTAQFLTVPLGAQHAWILVKGANPACWGANFDGTAPTANSGGEWPAGVLFKLDNDRLFLQKIQLISCTEGAATVKVYYTRDRRVND